MNQRARIIVHTDEKAPVPSVCGVWPVATWWEREAWDLYGVVFFGAERSAAHPDRLRVQEGHPLRKDFPADRGYRGCCTRGRQQGGQACTTTTADAMMVWQMCWRSGTG